MKNEERFRHYWEFLLLLDEENIGYFVILIKYKTAMGIIILIIISAIIVLLFHINESCSSFRNEKEIFECLNLTDEEIQRVKQLEESFVDGDSLEDNLYVTTSKNHPYGYKDLLIERAKRIGNREERLFGDESMILGISTFVVILVVYYFDIFSNVYLNHETKSYFLHCMGNNIWIADRDVYLCELYSFICFYVSFFLSYIGFGAYFVSYIGDNKVFTEK